MQQEKTLYFILTEKASDNEGDMVDVYSLVLHSNACQVIWHEEGIYREIYYNLEEFYRFVNEGYWKIISEEEAYAHVDMKLN